MLSKLSLRNYYKNAQFFPSRIDVLINPFYIIRSRLLKEIRRLVPRLEGKVLDFGCGSKPYQKLFNNNLVGVDIAISGHSHQHSLVDFFYDGKTLPFPDNSFDSIFSSEVFEHIPNLEEILLELRRVLKPSGQLLNTMPFIWEEHEIPYDFNRITSFGMIRIFEKNKFEIVEHTKSGNSIETIFQLGASYVASLFYETNKYLRLFLTTLFTVPLLILGCTLGKVLPDQKTLYLNNVFLVRKFGA